MGSTSASNPQWDFDVLMEPTFFSVTESYFLEATLELTFANTGPLTRKLVLPLARRANQSSLRSALSDASRTELVAITWSLWPPALSLPSLSRNVAAAARKDRKRAGRRRLQ